MQLLAYLLAYPFIWFISILPFRLLYLLSDITYFIIYKIVGYRVKTVRLNLALCLPERTDAERKIIEKEFYHYFCDSFFEMAKSLTISDKEIKKRFIFENPEVLERYEAKGKSVVMLTSHYGSYEWLLVMNRLFKTYKGFGIYKRIGNPHFDKLVRKIRGRFSAELVDKNDVIPVMRQNHRKGILGVYGFISDQSPRPKSAIHWADFFGMNVPVHAGGELLAKKLGMNIMFANVERTGRGYYKCTFTEFDEDPKTYPNFELTDLFLKMLEDQIRKAPQYYLWTHKRFKHRKNDPPGYSLNH